MSPASLLKLLCAIATVPPLSSASAASFVHGLVKLDTTKFGHHLLFLASNGHNRDDVDDDDNDVESSSDYQSTLFLPSVKTRRQFFLQQIISSFVFPTNAYAVMDLTSTMDNGYFSLRNNNNIPFAQRQQLLSQQKREQQERVDKRKRAASPLRMKKWTQFVNVKRWNSVETCLLEMLPVKNPIFRQLQELIEDLEVYPPSDTEGWKQTLLDSVAILAVLDAKRASLEPLFNQDDPTELYIAKASLGENNIEVLRSKLENLIAIASGDVDIGISSSGSGTSSVSPVDRRRARAQIESNVDKINMAEAGDIDTESFTEAKRQTLLALSELGELLVPAFPWAVPSRGKFSYLPRLLGRCTVTMSFERPSSAASAFGVNIGEKKLLGNVTIIADGYAAPITSGNFVDLSVRNFYTGLTVRAMRKRLGVVPTYSDNVIMNDLTELRDNFDELKDSALEFPEAFTLKKGGGVKVSSISSVNDDSLREPVYDGGQMTMDVVLPILGSYQEGFYDPLT
jgi:hypothetical protein